VKKKSFATIVFYLLIALGLYLILSGALGGGLTSGSVERVNYTQLVQYINESKINSITISLGKNSTAYIEAQLSTGEGMVTSYAPSGDIIALVDEYNEENGGAIEVEYSILSEEIWSSIIMTVMSFAVVGFILFFFLSQQGSGGGKVMSFGKSKAKMYTKVDKQVTFMNVAGADEEKEELAEIVDFLKYPDRYMKLGARIPKGVLLVGPPGTGKTLLARATAGEANVPFFTISGSDFVEMFVGVGASRVRDLFENAKKNAPCIVFIDEIDAVGRHRGAGLGGGNDEREQTLNQLLVEMDGFTNHQGIIIIAATNRPDILDPALLRPGRFDRQITVSIPDVKGRKEILQVHGKNKPLASDGDLGVSAKSTSGFTGADLENVMNEASLLAARSKKKEIYMEDLEEAIKRVIAGPEKKSKVVTEYDKKITAYHETGHAIVSSQLKHSDPVHEISIVPRGMAAGYTIQLPDNDNTHVSRKKLIDTITTLLGGRATEEVMLDDICAGAVSDIERATKIARRMITDFGMSDKLGPVCYGDGDNDVFIGKSLMRSKNVSEEVSAEIDKEIKRIIDECYAKAKGIVLGSKDNIELVVATLLEKETLSGDEFRTLIGLEPLGDSGADTCASAIGAPSQTPADKI
jgi:cell division protease FtsH